ncbi:MAG: HEAT repeat domain-containing protein [Verrucomicrobia bacterium]|nr:HEAT repeat domain-containing protein [Verrucomicrobiota bacterium]
MNLSCLLLSASVVAACLSFSQPLSAQHGDISTLSAKKLQPAEGIKVELFASDPLFFNPVAFSIDEKGRFFISETHRYKDSIFDIWAATQDWKDADASFRTVEERAAFLEKQFTTNRSFLTKDSEAIRLVEDRDGDGIAETSSLFADGFNKTTSGTAAGILARKGELWFTSIPDLWKFSYSEDGKKSSREVLHTGYGVHIGVSGHDLHGLAFGPDGKIYFSVGDRGANVLNKEGERLNVPDMGAVFRCNPDGTELEIFARGLRNPQELAFDQFGNLWAHDNDTSGEDKSRVLHIVEGGDYGWRYSYQFMSGFGPWVQEKVWQGNIDDVLPPAGYGAQGPSGLAFYPGVGLPDKYTGALLAADFPNGVWAYFSKSDGASYKIEREKFLWGFGATDVDIGPDCNVYVSDWGTSYRMPNAGRIYRVFDPAQTNSAIRAEVKNILAEGFQPEHTPLHLLNFLGHADQRVRFAAQSFLVGKGRDGLRVFSAAMKQTTNQLARVHAVWGIANLGSASPAVFDTLIGITGDADPEIRAQAAQMLGQMRVAWSLDTLSKLTGDSQPRVRFHAAIAMARIGQPAGLPAIIRLIQENADTDPFLTHAGVYAFQHIAKGDHLRETAQHENVSVRRAAMLAMRRLEMPEIAKFLNDTDSPIATEAARAINDVPINEAMPHLAEYLSLVPDTIQEPHRMQILSRAINANYRLGRPEDFNRVLNYLNQTNTSESARVNALDALADWEQPAARDRIVGLWRPPTNRAASADRKALLPLLNSALQESSERTVAAAIRCVEKLNIRQLSPALFEIFQQTNSPADIRLQALQCLAALKAAELNKSVALAVSDPDAGLRAAAVKLSAQLNPNDAAPLLEKLLSTEKDIRIGQAVYATLGELPNAAADEVLSRQLDRLLNGKINAELQLDLVEAARKRTVAEVQEKLRRYEATFSSSDSLARFRVALTGGDSERGKKIFNENEAVGCLRCHAIKGKGGIVGPDLAGIGKLNSREFLLESLLFPNKRIASGYENVIIKLKNGAAYAGLVKRDTETELVLESPEDGTLTLSKAEIEKRDTSLSAMPDGLESLLSKRELRDLVEYLSKLK